MAHKRFIALALALALLTSAVVPVTAHADEGSTWTELLELSTVNDSGINSFSYTTSATISVSTGGRYRIAYVDILFACTNGTVPNKVGVLYNGQPTYLKVTKVNESLARAYGAIVNTYYDPIQVRFERTGSGSSSVEVLSLRCNRIATQSFACDAELYIPANQSYTDCPGVYYHTGDGANLTVPTQFPVIVYDWQKFDTIVVSGSIEGVGINSIRASIHTLGVPYEITYTASNPSGSSTSLNIHHSYRHYESSGTSFGDTYGDVQINTEYRGKTLFYITIDLSGIDRTITNELLLYFTGVYSDDVGYTVQIVGVEGMIAAADTTTVTWWNRFTAFMTELVGGDTSDADQFAQEMDQANQQIADANQQMNSVTKPSVEDVPLDPSQFLDPSGTAQVGQIVQTLLGNELVLPMASITLIVGLASFLIF